MPATASGTDTVIVSVMMTTGVCVGVGVCTAAAVTDADTPLVVLAVEAGEAMTEALAETATLLVTDGDDDGDSDTDGDADAEPVFVTLSEAV